MTIFAQAIGAAILVFAATAGAVRAAPQGDLLLAASAGGAQESSIPAAPIGEPSNITLPSGLTLHDWNEMAAKRLAAGETEAVLAEGAEYLLRYGPDRGLTGTVDQGLKQVLRKHPVHDEKTAKEVLPRLETLRKDLGPRPVLILSLARARHLAGDFEGAKAAYSEWLQMAAPTDLQRPPVREALLKANARQDLPPAFHDPAFAGGPTPEELKDPKIAFQTRAILKDPKNANAYIERGVAYWHKGLLDQAIADTTKAIELRPGHHAYFHRGLLYLEQGMLDLAIADLTKAIELKPDVGEYHGARGFAYAELKRWEEARADYEKAIQLAPELPWVNTNLAWLLATCPAPASCRDGKRGVELALKAIRLGGNQQNPKRLSTLAAALAEVGNFEDAVKAQEEAITLLRGQKGNEKEMADYMSRLELYKSRKPFWKE